MISKEFSEVPGVSVNQTEKQCRIFRRRTTCVLIAALILDLLAFTCILPLFPTILDFYSLPSHRDWLYDKFVSSTERFQEILGVTRTKQFHFVFLGGFLGSMFSSLQFLSCPVLGALSDVYGRKLLLILSVTGSLISYLAWSQATTFTLFVLSRFIGGLSKASVSISTAVISDIYSPNTVGRGMALIGVAFSIGFLAGPVLGAYFAFSAKANFNSEVFFAIPAKFAIILTVLELLLILFLFPETLPSRNRKIKLSNIASNVSLYLKPNALFTFAVVKNSFISSELQKLQIYGKAYFAYLFLYSGMEFTLSFLTRIRFQYDSLQQGKMYLFIGIIMVFMQGSFVRKLPSVKHRKYATIGIWTIIPAFIIIGLSQNIWMFYFGLALYSISSAIVVPCLTSCVSNLSLPESKGATLGVFRSLGSLSRASGPIVSSTIFWLAGPDICYFLGGILLITPIILLQRISAVQKAVIKEQ